jgi:hypothetical protein
VRPYGGFEDALLLAGLVEGSEDFPGAELDPADGPGVLYACE